MKSLSPRRVAVGVLLVGLVWGGCSTLPEEHHEKIKFPENVYVGPPPKREYVILGTVKSKVNFATLESVNDEDTSLCKNYFNAAAKKLLEYGKKKGADAVINVRSVVFFLDGKSQTFPRAECSDDGAEGQVLAIGTAVKWKASPTPLPRLGDPWDDLQSQPAAAPPSAVTVPAQTPVPSATPSSSVTSPGDPRARIRGN